MLYTLFLRLYRTGGEAGEEASLLDFGKR